MSSIRTLVYRLSPVGGALALTALSACTSGSYIASTWIGPKTSPAQDFVVKSRPESVDYIPIHSPTPGRTSVPKTADQVKAAEQELDSLRERNVAAGEAAAKAGNTPPPDPVLAPAGANASKAAPGKNPAAGRKRAARKPAEPAAATR